MPPTQMTPGLSQGAWYQSSQQMSAKQASWLSTFSPLLPAAANKSVPLARALAVAMSSGADTQSTIHGSSMEKLMLTMRAPSARAMNTASAAVHRSGSPRMRMGSATG